MSEESEEYRHESEEDGSFFYSKIAPGANVEDHDLTRKFARQRIEAELTEKSEQRQTECWCDGCVAKPVVWVREVQFDMRGDKVGINQHVVSTKDYDGPVPGFCFAHIANGTAELAEFIYWQSTEIYLGLRPRKWWVIFTDGTKQGGLCEVLNPKDLKPSTLDLHIKSFET